MSIVAVITCPIAFTFKRDYIPFYLNVEPGGGVLLIDRMCATKWEASK